MRYYWALCLLFLAISPVISAPGWKPVPGTMRDGRWAPSACVLRGGKAALLVGGYSYASGACVASADVFIETTRRWHHCKGRLTYPRDFAAALPCADASVVIIGGYNTIWGTLATAERYSPRVDKFTVLGSQLSEARELFTATLLDDGQCLIAGGFNTHAHQTLNSAEIYDPRTRTFTLLNSHLIQDRFGHAAVRLTNGNVLLVGGTHWRVGHESTPLATAEIYDPRTQLFHTTAHPMTTPRDRPTATLLPDGTVLIAGGQNGAFGPRVAELFHRDTETFTPLASTLTQSRMAHSDITLADERVLLAGGWGPDAHSTLASTELFDFRTQTFMPGPALPFDAHDMALLAFPDGLILAAGGKHAGGGHETSNANGAYFVPFPSKSRYLSQ